MASPETTRTHARSPQLLFLLLGLIEGLVWWAAHPFGWDVLGEASLGACAVFAVTSVLLVARFTWSGDALGRWATTALGVGAAVALVTALVWRELPPAKAPFSGDEARTFYWFLGCFVALYVAVPFLQIRQDTGSFRVAYAQLFRHSWGNFFVGLIAAVFTYAVWLVLWLWSALFDLLHVSVFSDLFSTLPFRYLVTFVAIGYGLALGRDSEAVIQALRRITLLAARALLPVVAGLALIFTATLPVVGLAPLWETGKATPILLALLALLAVLLNGVIEEGEQAPGYPRWLLRGIEASVLAMPVLAAIAAYGTTLRVRQYGLTPDRVWALLFVGVSLLYAGGYALAVVWRRSPWLGRVENVNVVAALVVAALAVGVQLAPLDPLRLSAEDQARRLREGRVSAASFDFATLRFELGHRGWEQLAALEDLQDHPGALEIRSAVALVRAAKDRSDLQQRERLAANPVRYSTAPADLVVPDDVLVAMSGSPRLERDRCPGDECLILAADLDGDGESEYCLLKGSAWWTGECFARTTEACPGRPFGSWQSIGQLVHVGPEMRPTGEELHAFFRSRAIATEPARYRSLAAPKGQLELAPYER